ncbi:hypothetical protein EWB00_006036 [Schistosoma japonicum]|uniref:Uncharacterized protein n=1 Tax=Schistosoma japonicum TaxID=6182 RepID=A0A4Z2DTI8_SCHJA|nr:hypothetical protein EWB00_006036 [Schistosoma japonicum]
MYTNPEFLGINLDKDDVSKILSAMITISVIAEWSPSIHKDQLLKTLQPRDRSKVILRKFAKNICICMYPNGTVYTELIINQTLTDNCEWRLRVSRHGMGFEHKFTEDDISDESTEHFLSNISNKTTIHGGRWPTLSVTDDESYIIASGWAHHLWEPEATWRVYGVQPYIISNFNKTERNSPVFHRFFSNDIQNFKQSNVNKNTSSTSLSLSSSTVKVGSQQMLVLEAPAYYFDTLQHKAKHKYCSILKSKLTHLVQTELVMSLNILDKYRQAFQKFIFHIRTHPATNSKYNNDNNVTINTIADLLDKWLMLLDYKWRQSIRSHYKTNSIFNYHQVNNCSLSFKSSFEINFIGNDSDDKILIKFYEKQLKTKIYFSLFEIVQPIADWTGEQKRQWLRNPRVIKLFHYLHIKCPSLKKLRQASFILRQYLPNYAPEVVIHSKNTFHYGLMGSLETQTFKKLLIHNIKLANKLIDRAIHMKFEEYYFWPILRRINTKRIVEHSIFRNNDIRNEIQKMPLSSICYQLFIRNWKFYKKTDSFSSCFD